MSSREEKFIRRQMELMSHKTNPLSEQTAFARARDEMEKAAELRAFEATLAEAQAQEEQRMKALTARMIAVEAKSGGASSATSSTTTRPTTTRGILSSQANKVPLFVCVCVCVRVCVIRSVLRLHCMCVRDHCKTLCADYTWSVNGLHHCACVCVSRVCTSCV